MLNARKARRITPHVASPTPVAPNRSSLGTTLSASGAPSTGTTTFPRSFRTPPINIIGTSGHHYLTEDGREILDVSGGAAVSIFGPGPNDRIWGAICKAYAQYGGYHCGYSFNPLPITAFTDALVKSTNGYVEKAILYSSGSEAIEAMGKFLWQYHAERGQPGRRVFIAREQSYHGTTLAALSIGSYWVRRKPYEDLLKNEVHRVPACNTYRNQGKDEKDEQYLARCETQLRQKFDAVGREKIAGFICEPVVGAALGCVPAVDGYLTMVRKVCDEYDIPLVFDEIMCGWGRCGTLHAWQDEGVAPDIQLMGKGLVAGVEPLSAMLIGKKRGFCDVIRKNSGYFNHGHTFQGMAKTCAGALETMAMVIEHLPNVRAMGERLMKGLRTRLGDHPYVGDIRGKGLFIGLEFVSDKLSKAAFAPGDTVSAKIHELGLTNPYLIHVYPGSGSANPHGKEGDHIIIAPPYDCDEAEIDDIVNRVGNLVEGFFKEFKPVTKQP